MVVRGWGGWSVHRLTHSTLAKTLFIESEIISGENVKQVMHIWSQRCRQEPLLFEPAVATCYTRRIDHGAPRAPKPREERADVISGRYLLAVKRTRPLEYSVNFAYCSPQFIAPLPNGELTSPEGAVHVPLYKDTTPPLCD